MAEYDTSAEALVVEELVTGYGQVEVLHKLTFEARVGEVVAILGINGAGKSTFLNTIAGLHPVRGGSVRLFGKDVTRLKAHDLVRQGLVLVHEKRELFPPLTVEDNLRAALIRLRIRSRAETRARIDRIYELFPALHARKGELAGTLSGGEQQMLAISRALMVKPRVLLLDEPSLGLNPVIIEQIYDRLHELHAEGDMTIVIVEQHIDRALELATRGYVIDLGKVAASGTSEELAAGAARDVYMGVEDT